MTADDWERVIRQAAELGCRAVTFIGGEPTLSPALDPLARLTVRCGMHTEIYTNLVNVTPALWELFQTPGVPLAAT